MEIRTWVRIRETIEQVEKLAEVILQMQAQISKLDERLKAAEVVKRAYRRKSATDGD